MTDHEFVSKKRIDEMIESLRNCIEENGRDCRKTCSYVDSGTGACCVEEMMDDARKLIKDMDSDIEEYIRQISNERISSVNERHNALTAQEELKKRRLPHGNWKFDEDSGDYVCPYCNKIPEEHCFIEYDSKGKEKFVTKLANFCWYCGADMRPEVKEDEWLTR